VTVLAAIRPDEVNVPLLLHVLGAMLLVGTLFTVAMAIVAAWRRTDPADATALNRFGLLTLLIGVLPSYILMRIGAQWTEAEEDLPEEIEDSAWLGIGYVTADAGAILILVSLVLSGIGLRKLRAGDGSGFAKAVGIISIVLLAAYLVAVWAMSAKPD
jgi:hypothetical protein